jgi:hypothetical protein
MKKKKKRRKKEIKLRLNSIHLLKDKQQAQSLVSPLQGFENTLTFLLQLASDRNNPLLQKDQNLMNHI